MANEIEGYFSDCFTEYGEFDESYYYIQIGLDDGNNCNGAIRFAGIPINQGVSVYSAILNFYIDTRGSGSGDMKIKTYGIDEDNTAPFTSYPMGRPKTDAFTSQNVSVPPAGERFGINVKDQVNEILARGGWQNGNAIGFLIYNDGSPDNVWAKDWALTYLSIVVSPPNLTPGPYSTSASAAPPTGDWGIRVSTEGNDALTGATSGMIFTSDRKILRSFQEGSVETTAYTLLSGSHNQGYTPFFMGFNKTDDKCYRLPRTLYEFETQAQGYIFTTSSNIYLFSDTTGSIYYYIFVDDAT